MMRTNVSLLFALVVSSMNSAESEKIAIKNSSMHGGTLLLEAELTGKSVELECHTKEKSCKDLPPGDYSMVRLQHEGIYEDCVNVDIYKNKMTTKDEAVG
jgi:hypothetical protein